MNEHQVDKIPVGVSACLLGEEVRFNGGHKFHSYIDKTLGEYFSFRSFCPEVDIGPVSYTHLTLPTKRIV